MVNDFDADASNNMKVSHSFPKSGLTAGVESGLSAVEATTGVQAQQKTSGSAFRKDVVEEAGGSKNGKTFKFR